MKKNQTIRRLLIPMLAAICLSVRADVKMPAIFGDHMVLQGGAQAPVWGTADAGEAITVTAGSTRAKATAGPDGKWMAKLENLPVSGTPIDVTVAGKNAITFHDVLVGDVWLCSGQSNMEFGMGGGHGKKLFGGADGQEKFLPQANDSQLRFFLVKKTLAGTPASDVHGQWEVCTPETAAVFSAVGYFFGRDLRASVHRPIGLIGSYWGGTMVEAWTPGRAAEPTKKGKPLDTPAILFNGMIAPIIPFGLKGVIWYQGESNTYESEKYHLLFSNMIQDWRTRWGQGDFPFLYVQLASFMDLKRKGQDWPILREAQVQTLSLPDTGMASAVDIGNPKNIHPSDKFDVGHRLALAARHVAYGEDVVDSGPLYQAMTVSGNAIRVTFTHEGGGLKIGQAPWVPKGAAPLPTTSLIGFVVAGADKKWVPADAKIDGDAVVVSSPQIAQPVAVRYEWENAPQGNLYNQEDLPASPFRTDDWASSVESGPAK